MEVHGVSCYGYLVVGPLLQMVWSVTIERYDLVAGIDRYDSMFTSI